MVEERSAAEISREEKSDRAMSIRPKKGFDGR